MKAAWDWHLPRETETEQRELVEFVDGCGFDTLIINNPTHTMLSRGRELGLKVVAIVKPPTADDLSEPDPESRQRMLPVEEELAGTLARGVPRGYQECSFRWYPLFQSAELLCFESPVARELLETRVREALQRANGIAFDGFGFRNHYACFCPRCEEMRTNREKRGEDLSDVEVLTATSEDSLINLSTHIYDFAKAINPDAVVTNHLWPPFRPNPYYGHRLKLDYCSQTISWFYRPVWSLARVELEAKEMKQREDPETNRFVPFIGLHDRPGMVRPPERINEELAIARRYGDGNLVFCTLSAVKAHSEIRKVLQDALKKD